MAALRWGDVDFVEAVIRAERGKTGALHVVPLWPECVAALKAMGPRGPDDLVFITERGRPVCYDKETREGEAVTNVTHCDAVRLLWSRICGPVVKRRGIGFYILRHTHRSLSGGAGDESAADVLMGHQLPGMRRIYQHISTDRLRAVSEHVRRAVLQ